MIGALLGRQLRHLRTLGLALCLGILLLEWLLVTVAARIDTGPGLRMLAQLLPPAIRTLLADELSMVSFGGLVAFGYRHPVVFVASLAFVVVVATLPSAERESGLIDLILARPVPRASYLVVVLLLLVAASVALPLSLTAGAALGLATVDLPEEPAWTGYLVPAGGLASLLLAVGGLTLLVAAGSPRRGRATSIAVGLTLVMFFVDLLAQLWPPLEPLRWLSLFRYYDPMRSFAGGAPWWHPAVLLSVFVVTSAAATLRFRAQDL